MVVHAGAGGIHSRRAERGGAHASGAGGGGAARRSPWDRRATSVATRGMLELLPHGVTARPPTSAWCTTCARSKSGGGTPSLWAGHRVVHRPEGRDRRAPPPGARDPRARHRRLPVPDDRLARDPGVGAADEPADGRRRRRPAGAGLPGRPPLLAARLQPDRRPGGVQSRAAVHHRVRALHRLRRVPVRPHQGGPRRRAASARRGGVWPGAHRAPRHRRRAAVLRGDRRVRHLRTSSSSSSSVSAPRWPWRSTPLSCARCSCPR